MISDDKLLEIAAEVRKEMKLWNGNSAGTVGAALLAENGKVYVGINTDICCGI